MISFPFRMGSYQRLLKNLFNKEHFLQSIYAQFCHRRSISLFRKGQYSVIVSTCYDVFYNLALEDWLYTNISFENRGLMVLWKNKPCVVIGRHQNPWAECNTKSDLTLSRRKSGGGTVYHDMGNLNISFFTPRDKYNRKDNLELIAQTLQEKFSINASVNTRDDLVYKEFKISGSAAKLGRTVAYHHCTLLLNVDMERLQEYLKPSLPGIASRATESVRSQCINLCDIKPSLTARAIMKELSSAYLRKYNSSQDNFMYVDPTKENQFQGIHELYHELKSWQWIYSKTPKFTVERNFQNDEVNTFYTFTIEVNKGYITCFKLYLKLANEGDISFQDHDLKLIENNLSQCLVGIPFHPSYIRDALVHLIDFDQKSWFQNCIQTMCL